ncbi:hypothetical protein [Bradyrhizobium sp. 164]|uniref:hypothetical protein n=1 Tax=Bradyrhizobium sp. 164 TaxID=2782637 RepID=UPI00320B52E4
MVSIDATTALSNASNPAINSLAESKTRRGSPTPFLKSIVNEKSESGGTGQDEMTKGWGRPFEDPIEVDGAR